MGEIENIILLEYNKQVADLHKFCLINSNSILINQVFRSTSKLIQSDKDYKLLLLIAERWNELVSVINIARYYLREAIKKTYEIELYNSLYSTRMMHLYTANIWYNSIMDYILQFYYLIDHAKEINDNNYAEIIKDNKIRNNSVRKQCIPEDELETFEQMCRNLSTRDRGNDAKHRRVNLLPQKFQNKYGIGILPHISFANGKFHFDSNDITSLSSDKIQNNTMSVDSFILRLIKTDKTYTEYIQKMEAKYINPKKY